jgi:hypothetical protein
MCASFVACPSGHSGHKTSEFVSRTLIPTVALSLATLHSGSLDSPFETERKTPTPVSILNKTKKWLFDEDGFAGKKSAPAGSVLDWKSPDKVEVALQKAFEALDKTIVWDRECTGPASSMRMILMQMFFYLTRSRQAAGVCT